jgi:hypothetical protein
MGMVDTEQIQLQFFDLTKSTPLISRAHPVSNRASGFITHPDHPFHLLVRSSQ